MTEVDHTPSEIVVGLEYYEVDRSLRQLLASAAAQRGLTADPPGKGYVAVRPAAWGTVSAYFHRSYVDVAVSPALAEKLHRTRGWKLVKTNSETGFIRIDAVALGDTGANDLALQALLSAVDKSATGTAYEGGKSGSAPVESVAICPTHFVAMAGGRCDACE
jgi:hypothetical protein